MKRYTHIVLRRMPSLNGFSIKTPEAKFLSDIRPRGIVRELNRLNDRIKQLETEKEAANDMFKKLNIHALNLAARIKQLEEAKL